MSNKTETERDQNMEYIALANCFLANNRLPSNIGYTHGRFPDGIKPDTPDFQAFQCEFMSSFILATRLKKQTKKHPSSGTLLNSVPDACLSK